MTSDNSLITNGSPSEDKPTLTGLQSTTSSWWRRLRAAVLVAQVRLRFLVVFLIGFLVIGNWDTLLNYWNRWTTSSASNAPQAVSVNAEYFCPMCPGVISDWPTKCPVCNMGLVRRQKGGPVQLPNGVVSRMQYSPYRLQLAGVRTAVVDYLPLATQVSSYGFARLNAQSENNAETSGVSVDVQVPHRDAALVNTGQDAEISCTAQPGQGPWHGHVASVSFESPEHPTSANVRVDIADPSGQLSRGMVLLVRFELPIAAVEPFRSQPVDPEPLLPDEPRRVFICPNHRDVIRLAEGKCPRDGVQLIEQPLTENERFSYWCPMHPEVTSRVAGQKCEECGGMTLLPRVAVYRPGGKVLAVPESAVIDTGTRRLVYVDRGDGMFDGVEVEVGPRVAGCYAVVGGLEAGQRVATSGAFLLDAETRLNPNAASAYFGATTASGVGSATSAQTSESTP